jgi:hypothetical protein
VPTQTTDELGDDQRTAAINDRYSSRPEFASEYQAAILRMLADGRPVDVVVENITLLVLASAKDHGHPAERAAAALWFLGRMPQWFATPTPDGA